MRWIFAVLLSLCVSTVAQAQGWLIYQGTDDQTLWSKAECTMTDEPRRVEYEGNFNVGTGLFETDVASVSIGSGPNSCAAITKAYAFLNWNASAAMAPKWYVKSEMTSIVSVGETGITADSRSAPHIDVYNARYLVANPGLYFMDMEFKCQVPKDPDSFQFSQTLWFFNDHWLLGEEFIILTFEWDQDAKQFWCHGQFMKWQGGGMQNVNWRSPANAPVGSMQTWSDRLSVYQASGSTMHVYMQQNIGYNWWHRGLLIGLSQPGLEVDALTPEAKVTYDAWAPFNP